MQGEINNFGRGVKYSVKSSLREVRLSHQSDYSLLDIIVVYMVRRTERITGTSY